MTESAPPEVIEEVARAISAAQGCGRTATPLTRRLAAAAVAAYRATQDGGAEGAVRRVEALAVRLGHEAELVDPFTARVGVAERIRAALAPQAGDGAR